MMEWDSRMQNNHSVKILKAAIPFFDIEIGERIDLEGLLLAVRPFAASGERRILDLFLQFFQMRRMFDMMQLVQSMQQMQQMQEMAGEFQEGEGGPDMMSILKSMVPPEQQEMVDSMAAMMSMMQSPSPQDEPEKGGNSESVDI